MTTRSYSSPLVGELSARAAEPSLHVHRRPTRYEPGTLLRVRLTGLSPAVEGEAELLLDKFLGGGFAGQVYRARLQRLSHPPGTPIPGLEEGRLYAVKIVIPPSSFSRGFRNTIYWLAFQGPFSAQVNHAACRAGLLWQKLMRRAARLRFGRDTAVKDAYASFYDPTLQAYGEITEWIEGRMWRLEADDNLKRRRAWRTVDLNETASAEYVAKRRFMADLVRLMHGMGAPEFARQYEWSTMKSQPNVMKRTDTGETGPAGGLCAIDFRAGLALLPWLPMSPGDFKLIAKGLFQRGALVQFDRGDMAQLDRYLAEHREAFRDLEPAVEELKIRDRAYRRSLPDLTHHGFRLLWDRGLRADVRRGLVEGYRADDLVDDAFARRLAAGSWRFPLFYLLGAVPLLGRLVRKRWGHAGYRRHVFALVTSRAYRRHALRAHAAARLIGWHRSGRTNEQITRYLADRPVTFLLESLLFGWMPIFLHRLVLDPLAPFRAVGAFFRYIRQFLRDADFRERWFLDQIAAGEKEGMLTAEEATLIRGRIREPFIVKYLQCIGVHLATLPVTQVVSVLLGAVWAGWLLAHGKGWGEALATFGLVLAFFQITPISPGSICRGAYVVYLMIRERNVRDYLIAGPLSFAKYIGYLAFPLQMTTTYPHLARFMAARWATDAIHIVPVFGEKGALLEHWVFDAFFNVPQVFGKWALPRLRGLLTAWLALGAAATSALIYFRDMPLSGPGSKSAIQLLILMTCVFVLPRVLFYPILSRKK